MITLTTAILALLVLIAAAPSHASTRLDLNEAKRTASAMLQPLAEGLDGKAEVARCSRGSAVTVACRATLRLPDGTCSLRIRVHERRGDYIAHVRSMRCG
jgi:hypothetical protein